MPRGFGIFSNPKKALYNKIYRKTTFGIEDIGKTRRKNIKHSPSIQDNKPNQNNMANNDEIGKIIRSTNRALKVTSQNFSDLRNEINEIYELRDELSKKLQITKLKLYSITFLHILSYPLVFGFFYKKISDIRIDLKKKIKELENQLKDAYIKLTFADASQFEKSWLNCTDTFSELIKSKKVWDLTFSQGINTVKERTNATTAFKRTIIHNSKKEIEFIKSDLPHIFIPNANGPDLFIFPTFLILYKNRQDLGILDLTEINATLEFSSFIEEEGVPKDTEVISYTWKKANKDGSMDKRFKGNYQIPIVRYGKLTFQSDSGLEEGYMFSNFTAFDGFSSAYNYHLLLLTKLQGKAQPHIETKTSIIINTPQKNSDYKVTDEREAICPYCKGELKKIPGSKTKCPHCNKYMLVRTNPKGIKKVVTKEEADKIEEEWAIESGNHDEFIDKKEKFKAEKESLKEQFGKMPSDNDVKWRILNKELMENAQSMDFGLYRNTRFNMGEILRKENRLKPALGTYLEVCYIDLNGPNNRGSLLSSSTELLKEFPPFTPKDGAFLAPGVIDRIKKIIKKLDANEDTTKKTFFEASEKIHKTLKLPLKPETCWATLWKELKDVQ